MSVEQARSIWAEVEKYRQPGESWVEACEREMLLALRAEKLTQEKMAEVMSCHLSLINRRLEKLGLRPRGRRRAA